MTDGPLPADIVNSMREGVYVVDRDRRITVWNRGASQIAGFTADEVVGRLCGAGILNHVDENGQGLCGSRCPLRATMADGVPRDSRVFLHHQDGRLVPVLIRAAPLRDETGAIIGAVESFRDDSERVSLTQRVDELEHLMMLDPLTGIGNRRQMDVSLQLRLTEWRQSGVAFGALLIDLDRFKNVNDEHGHDTGDDVLRIVGKVLVAAVRPEDVVVRFGGEEFLVVTGPIDSDGLGAVARQIVSAVGAAEFGAGRESVRVTASAGATLVQPDDDVPSLLRRADQSLLHAKRGGRDRAVVA